MKKTFLIVFSTLSFMLLSCGSDDSMSDNTPEPMACFEISKDEAVVGEEVTISDCSVNASEITFSYLIDGEEVISKESEFKIQFSTPGEYQINLKVSNPEGVTSTISKTLTILSGERYFKFFDYDVGEEGIPTGFGINEDTQEFYFLEFNRIFSTNSLQRRLLYKELTSTYEIDKTSTIEASIRSSFLGHSFKTNNNSENIFIPILPTPPPYVSPVYTLDQNGNLTSKEESFLNITHGLIEYDGNQAYYGGNLNASNITIPTIQIRDNNNTLVKAITYDIGSKSGFIGTLIKNSNGYIGFGGSFDNSFSQFDLVDYTPVVYFFDGNLELIKYKEYTDTALTNLALQTPAVATWFHIEELNSGNLVLYGLNELIITDSNGEKINSKFFSGQLYPSHALIGSGDSFIISTKDFLRKFDASGNEIKNVFFDGDITPKFIKKDNNIFFISGYNKTETVDNEELVLSKIFMGAIDEDLNFVNLN